MPRAVQKLTIVGLGATGQSLGLALRAALPDIDVVGHDRDPDAARAAKQAGSVKSAHWNLVSACDEAAVVILALPARECISTLQSLRDELAPGTVVTDTAPLKLPLVRWAAQNLPPTVHFVGGHPLAVVDPPRAGAFSDSIYCLTPAPDADADAVAVVSRLVESIGARPAFTDPTEHDGLMWELVGCGAVAASLTLSGLVDAPGNIDVAWLAQAVPQGALQLASLGEKMLSGLTAPEDWATARRCLVELRSGLDDLIRRLDEDTSSGQSVAEALLQGRLAVLRERPAGSGGVYDEAPPERQSSWRRMLGMR